MNPSSFSELPQLAKRGSKRLKVGRACYTCRAKKIKCDGLRPCMQCKARQRPCSFYKDGSLELDQQQDHTDRAIETSSTLKDQLGSPSECNNKDSNIKDSFIDKPETEFDSTKVDNDDRIFFTDTSAANHNKLKRRGPLMESRISNTLGSLGENLRKMSSSDTNRLDEKLFDSTTDTFGNFIMWMPEPSLPSRYSGSIEMPSRKIQMALIDQFFSERFESIAMMPRYYFYEQLETKGLLITPLLLNVIYAHAARFVTIPNCPKTEVFYHRAKRLVDDFMDVPRVSTIVALGLLSLYEPSPAIYRPGAHHCRQWQYSGMACRMAIELGLYDDTHIHTTLSQVEIELRRRVFWGCYELDKFHSGGWERPYMISRSYIKTLQPTPLPEESEDEKYILRLFNAKLRFVSILEDGLMFLCASHSFQTSKNTMLLGIQKEELLKSINTNHGKHQQWLRSLAPEMQWTPITTISVKDVLELPAPRPMVGQLHLYYNANTLELLTRLPSNSVTQFQSRVTAACMTQLVYHLCQTPSYIVKFDFLIHAIILAIKIHLRHLDDSDISLAQQAWLLFDRSIWCMQLINSYAVIPNCTKFLQQVQSVYGLQMSSAKSEAVNNKLLPNKNRPSSSENTRAMRQQSHQVSPLMCDSQQQPLPQSVPLTDDGNHGMSGNSINNRVQYNLDPPPPSYITSWASTTQHPSNQNDQAVLQLGTNTNTDNMIYIDHHYQFPTHSRTNSNASTLLSQQGGFDRSPSNSNTTTTQLWPSHSEHHRQVSSSLKQQFSIGNRNENNDVISYNGSEIVVPSQLLVDDTATATATADNSMYQPQPSSSQQQQSTTNSPTGYAQHLNTNTNSANDNDNNLIWQQGPNNNMNDNHNHTNNNSLDIYRQHYREIIKKY